MGWAEPRYAHIPLIHGADGAKYDTSCKLVHEHRRLRVRKPKGRIRLTGRAEPVVSTLPMVPTLGREASFCACATGAEKARTASAAASLTGASNPGRPYGPALPLRMPHQLGYFLLNQADTARLAPQVPS